ncbi:MAG: exodeoxyribonuclease VII small subunit [Bacteroidota bacterium]
MMSKKPVKQTFEAALKRLEEIVELLESSETPLDQSIDLYEEGLELSRFCASKLKGAEVRFKKLAKASDGQFELTDLDS